MSVMPSRLWRRCRRVESGFTILEVMVASALLLLVLGTVSGVLVSLTNSENRSQALVNNQERVRLALVRIARDLRSAAGLNPLDSASQYPWEVAFTALDGASYRWRLDTGTGTMTREKLVSGSWQPAGAVLNRVTNADSGVAVFRYYRASSNLEVNPATSTNADIANCTIRVHVTISSASDPGPKPFTSENDVRLRNRLPAGIPGC